jgi:hypothetical protein
MLAGAAMLTGWYKTYFASKPALFVALAGQFVAACAWLVWGGGRSKGAASKRFNPWLNLVAPGVGGFFRTYIGGVIYLIGTGAKGGAEGGAAAEEKKNS